ncbi:hypothetical protein ABH944_004728 [Caballeronia udeis]|uniref:Lipoprotein n=1 Tax=Caballeronia udeis TaxID=1232866 RepID=A0ABW8MMW1_9BURK|nr:hypothetical protein [Caballeronia sp. dw_19]
MYDDRAFEAGWNAGVMADGEPDAFEFSQYKDEYREGFVFGYGYALGFRMASSWFGVSESGRMVCKYSLWGAEALGRKHFKDPALLQVYLDGYNSEMESEAEDDQDD